MIRRVAALFAITFQDRRQIQRFTDGVPYKVRQMLLRHEILDTEFDAADRCCFRVEPQLGMPGADPRIARVQTAEAYFYLGELALLRADVAEARRRFDAVVDLVGKDVALKRLSAYAGAMAELRRLPR